MIVQTDKGQIEGVREGNVTVFRGVPFAAPPTGGNRWRAPQPATAWPGVRKADKFGPACVQPVFDSMEGSEPVAEMNEDCLYLNVWTPDTAGGPIGAHPVMVWVHGGAFKLGEGRSLMYSGGPLAHKGAVVVTFNYRLGYLGFFSHAELDREQPGGPVNFGLLDVIAALQWVKTNIAKLGGDPNNVTVFGQSAGAVSVLSLMVSPLATGLFDKAIAHSAYAIPEHTRDHARAVCTEVAQRAWGTPPGATLAELRAVPAEVFARKTYPSADGSPGNEPGTEPIRSLAPCAIHGDPVLPGKVRARFDAGDQLEVPLLIGSNDDEQSVLRAFGMDPAKIYDVMAASPEGRAALDALDPMYRADPDLEPGAVDDHARFAGLILRDALFTMQARWIATRQARQKLDAFRYFFTYVPEALRPDRPHGVGHGGEIVFPFNTGDLAYDTQGKLTERDRAMADQVSTCWLTFARTGKPAAPAPGVEWKAHTLGQLLGADHIVVLGDTITARKNDFKIQRLDFFATFYPTIEKIIEDTLAGGGAG
ncbi:MAG TPA: carboxylesterase family protein [Kofleriaceae bacterium]|nr:carboxylesterase family protein [Kofleriaceae bacterium]